MIPDATAKSGLDRCDWDAIVIGAGPSGAMAARELARGGASVLLVERHDFPREKVCGGCLNGRALGVLESVGLGTLARRSGGDDLDSLRLGQDGREWTLRLPIGMAVPRGRFDEELVNSAIDSGVHFLPRTEARVAGPGDHTLRVELGRGIASRMTEARLVLVATGLARHGLPRGAQPRTRIAPGSRIGAGCFLEDAPTDYGPGTIHMAVGKAGYVGLVRLLDGRLHAAAALRPDVQDGPGVAAEGILLEAGFPPVLGLREARWKGTAALTRRTRPLADHRLLILGDAAGYVEPFTGEGIAWALESGQAISHLGLRAVESWEPGIADEWGRAHSRLVRRRQSFCRAASFVLGRPLLVRAVFEAARFLPRATSRILDILNAAPPLVESS